ncbi:(d)CMP kinase [Ilumatobacter sp.]|uniref:(d)CMP kinase n=1 Tax=Ilumatobacter sp. TaxID=1967498 RepID=UPI003B5278C3
MSPPEVVASAPEVTVVAIDGPAGAGKSTVGRGVAAELGVGYLDTGAMYRAVTVAVLRRGIDPDDDHAVASATRSLDMVIDDRDGVTWVSVDGVDATGEIRGSEVTAAVSAVAANSAVRAELVERQRRWVRDHGGAVVEGRDIGSVVFPDAALKLYVTASPRVRAERRVAQSGGDVDEIEDAIRERDRKDSSRTDSPLVEASDAQIVDTTVMSIDEVVADIVGRLRR